jgi:hypothetical protein
VQATKHDPAITPSVQQTTVLTGLPKNQIGRGSARENEIIL